VTGKILNRWKQRLMGAIRSTFNLVRGTFKRFFEVHCETNASALAFSTLLAMVPLAAVVFASFSLFPEFESWSRKVEEFVYRNFVPAAGDVIQSYLREFAGQAGKLTAVGLVFLIVSALLLLFTIEDTFHRIFRVERRRSIIQRMLAYWAVLTLAPLLIGASLSLSSYLISVAARSDQVVQNRLLGWLPLVFELMAFVLLYTVAPNKSVRLRHAFTGALLAAILFEASKQGFAYFVLNFRSYEVIYGALATIPIFLVWIYLSWLVVLVGAVLVAELGDRSAGSAQGKA